MELLLVQFELPEPQPLNAGMLKQERSCILFRERKQADDPTVFYGGSCGFVVWLCVYVCVCKKSEHYLEKHTIICEWWNYQGCTYMFLCIFSQAYVTLSSEFYNHDTSVGDRTLRSCNPAASFEMWAVEAQKELGIASNLP